MDKTSLVKVFLHDRGEDVESAWCQPVGASDGAALFRLVNVPFLHAKPTYGDVIAARRDDRFDGNWAWDRQGVPWARVRERLHSDGERYALIVDYTMRTNADFGALVAALERQQGIVAEGCFGPRGEEPGRLYLAAPRTMSPADVMAIVTKLGRFFQFALVHPLPPKATKKAKPKATKPKATKPKATKAKATKPKAAKSKPAKSKPATKKSAGAAKKPRAASPSSAKAAQRSATPPSTRATKPKRPARGPARPRR